MIRSPKILLLLAATFSLAACESAHTVTKPLDAAPPLIEVAQPAPTQPIVVRSAIVPDDPIEEPAPVPAPVHKPRPKPAIVTASVAGPALVDEPAAEESAPVLPAKPAPVIKPAPEVKPAIVEKPVPAAKHADAAEPPPAPVITPPAATTPTSITPPPAAAPPAAEPPPPSTLNVSPSWLPKTWPKDPKQLLQVPIGGMPLWLVVLFVLLAFISLVIGFRGKKAAEPVSAGS